MNKSVSNLHALGWSVHWLRPKSKIPVANKWTSSPDLTLTELEKSYRPGFNVGVRLGRALPDKTFLAVIDCDVKNPKASTEMLSALDKLFAGWGVAYGPSVMSGRGNGSMHIYIRTPAPFHQIRLAASKKVIEGDTKRPTPEWDIVAYSTGRQVVVPPSIHPVTARPYTWAKPPWEIETPLVELKNKGVEVSRGSLKDFEPVPVDLVSSDLSDSMVRQIRTGEGVLDRSAALFGAAIAMRKVGFTTNEVLSVLTDRANFLGAVGYEHRGTESRAAAAAWVAKYTLGKATREAEARDDFEIVRDEDSAVDSEQAGVTSGELVSAGDWRKELERNQDKRPKTSLKNLLLIFENIDGPEPFLSRDEFAVEDRWLKPMPWGKWTGETLTDDHSRTIKEFLARKFRMEPDISRIREALLIIANRNRFHPVRDFLKTLKWDKVRRAETWLEKYLGATGPKEYVRAVSLKTLVAMVARVYQPGIKFDHVLILEGVQGAGKSSAARILADPWFSDAFLNVSDKDAVMNMQGTWVNELGELSAMSRSEVNSVKDFVTRQVDKIRPPYGALPIKYPRQNIFIGTTNNRDYLRDPTGNRRFWPVAVHQLDREGLMRDRDQLLAEALAWYWSGEPLYLNANDDALARIEQGLREEHDEMQTEVERVLAKENLSEFTFYELADIMPIGVISKTDQPTQKRVAKILRKLGFENESKWDEKCGKSVRKWRMKTRVRNV
jgi:predicted P-loop ATPase